MSETLNPAPTPTQTVRDVGQELLPILATA